MRIASKYMSPPFRNTGVNYPRANTGVKPYCAPNAKCANPALQLQYPAVNPMMHIKNPNIKYPTKPLLIKTGVKPVVVTPKGEIVAIRPTASTPPLQTVIVATPEVVTVTSPNTSFLETLTNKIKATVPDNLKKHVTPKRVKYTGFGLLVLTGYVVLKK